MIIAQDNYPSRSDLQSLRSVSVQQRAEGFQSQAARPKLHRLRKPPFAPTSREHLERPREGGGRTAEIPGRPASLFHRLDQIQLEVASTDVARRNLGGISEYPRILGRPA